MLQPARRNTAKSKGPQHRHRHPWQLGGFGDFWPEVHRPRPPDGAPDRVRASRHFRATSSVVVASDPHLPDKPISTKPAEVRMGNGKGNP